jgi:hypothetical protein
MDHYYAQQDGKWVRIDDYVFSDRRREDDPDFRTDFWVDLSHGDRLINGGVLFMMYERYYFPDRKAALDFYLEGWKERQFLDEDGNGIGLEHNGLYLEGQLVDGLSIYGDLPGHDGEHLRNALGRFCSNLDERQRTRTKRGTKKRHRQ